MALFDRTRTEIERRHEVLPHEVGDWYEKAVANVDNLGVHRSQFLALKIMMDGLQKRQTDLLDSLSTTLPPEQFADIYYKLNNEIVGAHELWRIFSYIIAQHQSERFGPLLDAADLIAANCYRTCIEQATLWGVIEQQEFREPPLVYLEADISPSTASRGYSPAALSFPVRFYRTLRLPIPIVLLPYDQADSIWMQATLHHEVGHNVDQDLNLKQELVSHLLTRLDQEQATDEHKTRWIEWAGEVLADAFGVLLGGAGFAYALNSLLAVLAPAPQFQTLNEADPHPPFYVRMHLLAALLRQHGFDELNRAANAVMETWNQSQKPNWVTAYTAHSRAVAEVFTTKPLAALKNHSLSELVPSLDSDTKRARRLSDALSSGFNYPNVGTPESPFPYRLVPAAAQLAVNADGSQSQVLDNIQKQTLDFLKRIPRPDWLSGIDRSHFLSQLTLDLDFSQ
ncbi:MAG: hypothetical protein ABR556_03680 [Pyrinomonadaceae bacterium]